MVKIQGVAFIGCASNSFVEGIVWELGIFSMVKI
jgi:hypothetical protein